MLATLLAFAALPAVAARAQDEPARGDVVVEHQPAEVQTRTFDRDNPPPDMPLLNPGEAAVTESGFSCQTLISVAITSQQPGAGGCTATVRVSSVKLTLGQTITIWLPNDGRQKLTAHEDGHRLISERFYAGGKGVAETLGREMVGREFTATAATCDAAAQRAISDAGNELAGKYMAAVQQPAARVQELYDEVTDHGRNNLSETQAIERAIQRQRREARRAPASRPVTVPL